MLGAASKARGQPKSSSSKNGAKKSLKVGRDEEDEGSSDDSDPDDADLDLELGPQGQSIDLLGPTRPVNRSAGSTRDVCVSMVLRCGSC